MRARISPTKTFGMARFRKTFALALLPWVASCFSAQSSTSAPSISSALNGAPASVAVTNTGSEESAAEQSLAPSEASTGDESLDGTVDASLVVQRILDPDTLHALEADGFGFRRLLERIDGAARVPAGTSWNRLKTAIAEDVAEVKRSDPQAGVGVARYSHRLFDVRWLDDPEVRFELTGVVLRLDRFAFQESGCGEVRLIYRLGYEKTVGKELLASRLPATVGVELFVEREKGDPFCARAVRRWIPPETDGDGHHFWTSNAGPLAPARLRFGEGDLRVVTNVQTVRWPSTVRPAFGGHAEYALRTFVPAAGEGLRSAPLENTPDVARLLTSPELKRRFVEWLTQAETVHAIDVGNVLVPEEFLALRATSVTPRGLARRANRPFRSVLAPSELAGVDWSQGAVVRSAAAALRRLDQLSCPGCHQARTVAGFHFLGEEPEATPGPNRVAVPLSMHVLEDDARRRQVVAAALSHDPLPPEQPFAERADLTAGGYGAHCSLGTDPSYAEWSCAAGYSCVPYDEPREEGIGICLPNVSGRAGDPCELATVTTHQDPRRDAVTGRYARACRSGAVCNGNSVGFPGGMCTEPCVNDGTTRCGAIAVLDPFNACLARNEPFSHCLTTHVSPAGLRRCSASEPCRDDYLCAGSANQGVCVPPYFLFQMRVDGHR